MFQKPTTSDQDTVITLINKDSRQVAHGFAECDDPSNNQTELVEFQLDKPEILYEISQEFMDDLAKLLLSSGFILKSVHSYSHGTYRPYKTCTKLKELHA
jgi:hypothetical protein